jgi:hypothetical protein
MSRRKKIPTWIKIAYTLFICVMVPTYWRAYGPANFLWFCDLTAFVTFFALWLESPLLAGMGAVAMTVSQTAWTLDLLTRLVHLPLTLLGPTQYMFEPGIPLFVRLVSLFHVWMPILLLWMVWRLGYDRRSWLMQSVLAIAVLEACFLFTPRPPATPEHPRGLNINWVFGPGYDHPQTWMHPVTFITLQMLFYPLCVYLPTHLVFQRIFRRPGPRWRIGGAPLRTVSAT